MTRQSPVDRPAVRAAALGLHSAWGILPGRSVAHAIVGEHRLGGICGLTSGYSRTMVQELGLGSRARLCEACVMSLVTKLSPGFTKFFLGHVPAKERSKRRLVYRQWVSRVEAEREIVSDAAHELCQTTGE